MHKSLFFFLLSVAVAFPTSAGEKSSGSRDNKAFSQLSRGAVSAPVGLEQALAKPEPSAFGEGLRLPDDSRDGRLPSAFGEGLRLPDDSRDGRLPGPDTSKDAGLPSPVSDLSNDERLWIIVRASTKEERTAIAETGMSIEEIGPTSVAGIAHPNTVKELERLGFEIEYKVSLAEYDRLISGRDFPEEDEAYHNYDEIIEVLQGLVKSNSKMASLFSIGQSVEGREIWTLRLNTTASGTKPSDKPGAVFMGAHHAREHLSVEVPLLLAVWLCENKNEPEVKKLLDVRDIYIMPMVNPDGAEYDISTGKYKWHRKNMRVNPDKYIGVDLNRNYDFRWGGAGSSGSTWSDTYRGPYVFSEPEAQAVKTFVESRSNLKTAISYHSYSELILYPWGGADEPIPDEKDRNAFIAMAEEMAKLTGYTPQQSSDLYVATGDTTDWMYAESGIFAFTFELTPRSSWGGGFYPGAGAIAETVNANIKAAMYLIDMTGDPYESIPLEPAGNSSAKAR